MILKIEKIIINVSIIIPTYNRTRVLNNTINSIAEQDLHPFEIIIIDGSSSFIEISKSDFKNLNSKIIHKRAIEIGAAKQRNQGMMLASNDIIGFFDDDIILERNCLQNLWEGLQKHPNCGGINAVITNQSYHPLGKLSSFFYRFMGADNSKNQAGKCIGPAINFLPELNSSSNYMKVDWLNTTCTLYRKTALPDPVFDHHFKGYSLMEDLALSLRVGEKWLLLSSSKARIYHDSQPSEGKDNILINSEMDLVNRFYIMKYILKKTNHKDYLRLLMQQLFSAVASKKIMSLPYIKGKYHAFIKIKSI